LPLLHSKISTLGTHLDDINADKNVSSQIICPVPKPEASEKLPSRPMDTYDNFVLPKLSSVKYRTPKPDDVQVLGVETEQFLLIIYILHEILFHLLTITEHSLPPGSLSTLPSKLCCFPVFYHS
uniref:Uncharacterized protein n=1 Tax=Sus scrofa TaxID=9823 RepID=A0A4X1SIV4_PIG